MITRVVESASRGKVTVATREYLPGELILEEEPVMNVPKEYVDVYEAEMNEGLQELPRELLVPFANYCWFDKRIDADVQARVLSFSGRLSKKEADRLRELLGHMIIGNPDDLSDYHKITSAETELFVKIAGIMKLNKFVAWNGDQILYKEAGRFAHSCIANLQFMIEPHRMLIAVRASKHIRAGEEMTLVHAIKYDDLPTHVRRKKHLEERGFTCHCPRCDAPGDDTRQFDCFDPACKGVMMVCQPLSKEDFWTDIPYRTVCPPTGDEQGQELPMSGPRYDNVTYVEPHLLPCTFCHRAAPFEYQDAMFKLEEELPKHGEYFTTTSKAVFRSSDKESRDELIAKFESLRLPRRHALSIPIFYAMVKVYARKCVSEMCYFLDDTAEHTQERELCRTGTYNVVNLLLSALQAVTPGAHANTLDALCSVCHEGIVVVNTLRANVPFDGPRLPDTLKLQDAKTLLQRALRMLQVLYGRDCAWVQPQCADLEKHLLLALQELPVPQQVRDMQVCAFCEESPASAFMKRSRCGACQKVMYCSAGCQKAHWRLHKKSCV